MASGERHIAHFHRLGSRASDSTEPPPPPKNQKRKQAEERASRAQLLLLNRKGRGQGVAPSFSFFFAGGEEVHSVFEYQTHTRMCLARTSLSRTRPQPRPGRTKAIPWGRRGTGLSLWRRRKEAGEGEPRAVERQKNRSPLCYASSRYRQVVTTPVSAPHSPGVPQNKTSTRYRELSYLRQCLCASHPSPKS